MNQPKSTKDSKFCLWTGHFTSWDATVTAASEQANNAGGGSAYKSTTWFDNLQRYGDLAREGKFPRPSSLPTLVSNLNPKAIVDFGGANGWLAYLLPGSFTESLHPYVVLESNELINQLQSLDAHPNVAWLPSNKAISWQTLPSPLLLYSLSALQYFPNDALLSEIIAFHRPSYIALEDVPCVLDNEFYVLQNFYNFRIPYRFVSVGNLLRVVTTLGYRIERVRRYNSVISPLVSTCIEGHESALQEFQGFLSFEFSCLDS